jgi:hypothetical protein
MQEKVIYICRERENKRWKYGGKGMRKGCS